jgi:hypothetical protein
MSTEDYLERVLAQQTLAEDSAELKELRRHREDVEALLRKRFDSAPRIRYGGSKAKGTMNKESYDLDVTCYFPHDDESAGTTLAEIYDTVEEALRSQYWTDRKGSAIRLRSRDDYRADFHVDVVPGRFVDGDDGDVHLHRTTGEKQFLKTNLDVHVSYVKDSGLVKAIRLLKLWASRNNVGIKTFALELLTIDLLKGRKSRALADQLEHVLKEFRDNPDDLAIEDPANPHGNDLSELLGDAVRTELQVTARRTLEQVDRDGWEAVFGVVDDKADDVAALKRMAAAATVRPKPYYGW